MASAKDGKPTRTNHRGKSLGTRPPMEAKGLLERHHHTLDVITHGSIAHALILETGLHVFLCGCMCVCGACRCVSVHANEGGVDERNG